MFDPQRLLGQMLSGSLGGLGRKLGDANRDLSGMGSGFLGGGAKVAAGLGLLGVAMAAFEHYRQREPGAAADAGMPPPPPPPTGVPAAGRLSAPPSAPAADPVAVSAMHLLRSMIAAAHADGVLDPQERAAIVDRAQQAQLPAEDLQVLAGELESPWPLARLVAHTPAGLERETYAAALLAIRVDSPWEQNYLDQLAAALKLAESDRQLLDQQFRQ